MNPLREAAQQALEALEEYAPQHGHPDDLMAVLFALRAALAESGRDWSLLEATQESLREHMAEIHRLRAALAQQDEPVQVAERERIASQWDGCVTRSLDTFGPVDIGASIRAGELVEAQQAEPVEEPEGLNWRYTARIGYVVKPYTAPPQRTMVPLTAQELDGVIERHVGGSEITDAIYTSMEQFARAVEEASWEKNHG